MGTVPSSEGKHTGARCRLRPEQPTPPSHGPQPRRHSRHTGGARPRSSGLSGDTHVLRSPWCVAPAGQASSFLPWYPDKDTLGASVPTSMSQSLWTADWAGDCYGLTFLPRHTENRKSKPLSTVFGTRVVVGNEVTTGLLGWALLQCDLGPRERGKVGHGLVLRKTPHEEGGRGRGDARRRQGTLKAARSRLQPGERPGPDRPAKPQQGVRGGIVLGPQPRTSASSGAGGGQDLWFRPPPGALPPGGREGTPQRVPATHMPGRRPDPQTLHSPPLGF